MSFVLDASVSLNWCLEEPNTKVSQMAKELLLETTALVPPLWLLEMGNVLAVSERRGRIQAGSAISRLSKLLSLPISIASGTGATDLHGTSTLRLALNHNLTTYDATYLLLARARRLPLATNDRQLSAAASAAGVSLLGNQVEAIR